MSRHAYELCALLVDDIYGELTSQHLVLWYTASDDHLTLYEANTAVAYSLMRSGKYIKIAEAQAGEFAGKVIFDLLLLGHARVGELVEAYSVGQSKGIHGFLAATSRPQNKVSSSLSGHPESSMGEETARFESICDALLELLRSELVSCVHISHFRSDADNRNEAGKTVPRPEEYKAKSKREQDAQHEAAVKRKLKEWKYGTGRAVDEAEGLKNGKKRLHQDLEAQKPEKRQRLHSPLSQEVIRATGKVNQQVLGRLSNLDSNLVLRVNHAKFAVLMRNEHLVDLAGRTISTSTAMVYAQVLHVLQPKVRDCREERENSDDSDAEPDLNSLPQVSTTELVGAVKAFPELSNALGNSANGRLNMAQFDHPKARRKKEVDSEGGTMINSEASVNEADISDSNGDDISEVSSEVDGEADVDPNILRSHTHDPHRDMVRNHLLVLAIHPLSFLHHIPKTSNLPERWTIDFPTLVKNVTYNNLLETIKSRHGLPAARLTRILFDKGKTDEKVLCSISLLAQKTMRTYLLPLHKAGMIGLQEVPRDNSRNPQRTNFLWFFDPERCKAKILEETYKTMARFLRRARVEGEKVRGTVEKASRTDVIGREKEFLSVQELEALNVWKEMDERIWGKLSRLDDLVACLRDF